VLGVEGGGNLFLGLFYGLLLSIPLWAIIIGSIYLIMSLF